MSGKRANIHSSLRASDTSHCRKAPWHCLIGFLVTLFLSEGPVRQSWGWLSFQNCYWSSGQLRIILRGQLPGRASDPISIAQGSQEGLGQGLHKSFIPRHAPATPHSVQGPWGWWSGLSALLARFLYCLCHHSRVGEKEQPRRRKQTEERSLSLLTL